MEWHICCWRDWRPLLQNLEANDTASTYPREDDGAIAWRKLLPMFHREHPVVEKWKKKTWPNHLEKETITKDFSIALAPTNSFSSCVLFKAFLEGTKLIHLCRTIWKFRAIGLIISITSVLFMTAILWSIQECSQDGKIQKKDGKSHSSWQWNPWRKKEPQKDEPYERYLTERSGKWTRMQHFGSIWKVLKTKN